MVLEPDQQIKISGRSDRDGHFAELLQDGERLCVAMGPTVEETLVRLLREMEQRGINR